MNNLDLLIAMFLAAGAISIVGGLFCIVDIAVRVLFNHFRPERSAMRDWAKEDRR